MPSKSLGSQFSLISFKGLISVRYSISIEVIIVLHDEIDLSLGRYSAENCATELKCERHSLDQIHNLKALED